MTKEQAIDIVTKCIEAKPLSWEAIYHIDKNPTQRVHYWLFKNLREPRDAIVTIQPVKQSFKKIRSLAPWNRLH
jgi:hypothetical protein